MPPRVASGSPPGAVWIIPILVCALHPLAETAWVTRFTAWLTWKERANKQLFRLAPHRPMSLITSSSTTSCGGEVNKPVMVFLHTKCLSSYFPVFLSNLFQVEVYYLKGSTDSQDVTLGTHRIKQTKTGPYLFSPWLMLASSVPPSGTRVSSPKNWRLPCDRRKFTKPSTMPGTPNPTSFFHGWKWWFPPISHGKTWNHHPIDSQPFIHGTAAEINTCHLKGGETTIFKLGISPNPNSQFSGDNVSFEQAIPS